MEYLLIVRSISVFAPQVDIVNR